MRRPGSGPRGRCPGSRNVALGSAMTDCCFDCPIGEAEIVLVAGSQPYSARPTKDGDEIQLLRMDTTT